MFGQRLWQLLLLLGGAVFVASCQGDRRAEQWFAPDPQLQEQVVSQAEPAPEPNAELANPSAESETLPQEVLTAVGDREVKTDGDTVQLPLTFPEDVPSYPQAQLLSASYRAGQGTGQTLWQSNASPKKIANFYQQFLTDKGWTVEQRYSEAEPMVILRQDIQELRLTFPEAEQFAIAYQDTRLADAATPTIPTNSTAKAAATTDEVVAALQTLDVLPTDFDATALVNRRTFARWLFAAYNQLHRDRPSQQIRPANASSQPVFQDLLASDPDFAAIQGLAEAGIIPSRLTGTTSALLFQPDAPLTRERLLLWKVPLDHRTPLPNASVETIQQVWGFQDVAQIAPDVLPMLLVDYENGDRANVLRVFGFTTLFQPQKAATQSEAAQAIGFFGFQGEGITAVEALSLVE
ncbi:MAG: S-layer homology domain-containing protein [Cyanobacteria bacterium P01_G01_bin.54]